MKEYSKREWKKIFEDSIMDELCDAAYYHRMATMAPDYEAKDIILNIAADEECHARKLMDAYEGLFGIRYKSQLYLVQWLKIIKGLWTIGFMKK